MRESGSGFNPAASLSREAGEQRKKALEAQRPTLLGKTETAKPLNIAEQRKKFEEEGRRKLFEQADERTTLRNEAISRALGEEKDFGQQKAA